MVKIYFFLFFLFIFYSQSFAEKYYSSPNGRWCTNPNGSGKCVDEPNDRDDLVITREVTIKGPFKLRGEVEIQNGGKLTITDGNTGNLEVFGELDVKKGGLLNVKKDLNFKNNSEVEIEEGATVLVEGDFINSNNSDKVEIDGKLEVAGNFNNGNNGKIEGDGKISIAGSCSNSGEVFGVDGTCAGIRNLTLPVELLFFEAEVQDEGILLRWATSSEKNFDFFNVERSADAREFYSIGASVQGAGNSTSRNNYSFLDDSPLSGRSYYRLKATDFDGTVEYHKIIRVDYSELQTFFKVYPNPSRGGNIKVSINADPLANSSIKIYNIIGEEVYIGNFRKGLNEYSFNNPLDPGLYMVVIENGNFRNQVKLTVE
ncbi:hypothetical protein BH23BAC1_BH23BAC1_21840 [soil metagenome]